LGIKATTGYVPAAEVVRGFFQQEPPEVALESFQERAPGDVGELLQGRR
jgi:hypothetical protein